VGRVAGQREIEREREREEVGRDEGGGETSGGSEEGEGRWTSVRIGCAIGFPYLT
jgi:hypothetical protein